MYYHFKSKEEIFEFLVDEGIKLLINSIEIKIAKCDTYVEKLNAVSLIQLKAIAKYEELITLVLSHTWGNETKNVFCKQEVIKYIDVIENIVKEGIEKGELKECDPSLLATEIFSLTCSTLMYKRKTDIKIVDIQTLYKEYEKRLFKSLKK